MQKELSTAPSTVEYIPAGQLRHAVNEELGPYLPSGQRIQLNIPAELL